MSSRYMTIPKGAPNADAAWEFVKWLTGPEASRLYSLRRNLLPAHRDAVGDPAFADAFLFWDVQQAMLSHGIPEWGTVPIPDVANFLSVMELAYTKGLTRTVSPESALEEAARLMQAFLDEHLAD
jgi:ABC-type glycerol-3-phosphate transport system substrate-binding protein